MTGTPDIEAIGTIDHVVIVVRELDIAADIYRRLGFTLSPRGRHGAALGTENHTIMLRDDYFELLAVHTPTERNKQWRDVIAHGGGVAGMALRTSDPAGAREHWLSAGLSPDMPLKFSRSVPRPDGSTLEARFEVVSLDETDGLGARVFVCSQPTRAAVWLPELLRHANSAIGIRRIRIACPDPEFSAAQWMRALPTAQTRSTIKGVDVDTGGHTIVLARHTLADVQVVGVDYRVVDLAQCQLVLKANSVAHAQVDGGLAVAAPAACNVAIRFESDN